MKQYTVARHPLFGYLHLEPIPSREEVERYYREEFYSTNYDACNDSAQEKQDTDREFNHGRYSDMFHVLEEQLGPLAGRSLFDVGCGYGELLLYAQSKGMEIAGLEVAPEAVEHLQKQGMEVVLSDIDANLAAVSRGQRYDVVTLLNVLEHLREPATALTRIREHLLAPGGCLVIDVPNEYNPLQTAANQLFSLNEWWVAYPVHINYFTPQTLRGLLEACGFEVEDMLGSFPLEMFLLMGDTYVGNPTLGSLCHGKRVAFESNLRKAGKNEELRAFYRALASCGMGRQIVCFARPDGFSVPVPPKTLGQ